MRQCTDQKNGKNADVIVIAGVENSEKIWCILVPGPSVTVVFACIWPFNRS